MYFYKFRYDKDNYLIFKLKYDSRSIYRNFRYIEIKMMSVVEFNNLYRSVESLYRNISLPLARKNMEMYVYLYSDDYKARRIYEYLETEYDEEKINFYILQEKELKKKEREERNRIAEEDRQKKKKEREEKRLRRIQEEEERKQRQAERAPILAKEQEIYTREWKDRLNKFLNSVKDGTYNPPETKYGYIGYGVDNIKDAYNEYCMCGGYTDYESERM